MVDEPGFPEILPRLDLGPLQLELVEFEPPGGVDAYIDLAWDGARVSFAAEFKNARDLRSLQKAVVQATRSAEAAERQPLVVVPYLSHDWLSYLRSEGMSGIDLSGNGWIQVPGRWNWFQHGFPNRFPTATRTRAPYRGKSALVGRVLLSRPRFDTIGDVRQEIQRRGGSLSLGQVSKVLSALEDDLIIRKGDGVRLIHAERLLDSLAADYRRPAVVQEVDLKAELGPDILETLMTRAAAARARIAAYEPARYVVAPEPGERLLVYVEPRGFPGAADLPETEPVHRFANLTIRAIREPAVFFDTEEESGFRWCSPLEVFLQLMQGGKREQQAAAQLREEILEKARAVR